MTASPSSSPFPPRSVKSSIRPRRACRQINPKGLRSARGKAVRYSLLSAFNSCEAVFESKTMVSSINMRIPAAWFPAAEIPGFCNLACRTKRNHRKAKDFKAQRLCSGAGFLHKHFLQECRLAPAEIRLVTLLQGLHFIESVKKNRFYEIVQLLAGLEQTAMRFVQRTF